MVANLTEERLAEIKLRVSQATTGPWSSFIEARDGFSGSDFIQTDGEDIYLIGATAADHDFIAHARQDVPALIAEVERLRQILDGR